MSYTRLRCCSSCGRQVEVRKDNRSTRCRSCSARASGAKGLEAIRKRLVFIECRGCGLKFKSSASEIRHGAKFCSVACRSKSARVDRTCKQCGALFTVLRSSLSGKTNASGNFCCRGCYESWLCNSDRTRGYGSRWRHVRAAAIRSAPFCAICGAARVLDVHHIAPYRISRDNSASNLIPLCKSHHKKVESITADLICAGSSAPDIKLVMGSILRERQDATRMVILSILRGSHAF